MSPTRPPITSFHTLRSSHVLLIALYALGLILWRYSESLPLFTTHFLGGVQGDNGLYVWLFRHHVRHLFELPWFETNAFFPYHQSLAWSDNFILPGALGRGLVQLGLNEPASFNLILLGALVFNIFITALVTLRITGSLLSSLLSGTLFGFSSYFAFELGHPQLCFAFFLPAAFFAGLFVVRRPTLLSGVFASLVIGLCFLTSVYLAVFSGLCFCATVLAIFLLRPDFIGPKSLLTLGCGIIGGAIPFIPAIIPYLYAKDLFGERGLYEAHYFSASSVSYLSAPATNKLLNFTSGWTHPEANLFPGLVALLSVSFLLFSLVRAPKHRATALAFMFSFLLALAVSALAQAQDAPYPFHLATALCLWVTFASSLRYLYKSGQSDRGLGLTVFSVRHYLTVVLFLSALFLSLSFGPLGNSAKHQLTLGIFAPLYYLVPGFNSIRAVSRFGVGALLFLAIGSGIVASDLIRHRARLRYLVIAALLYTIIEQRSYIQPAQSLPATSPVYSWLEKNADVKAVVIALPFSSELKPSGEPVSWTDYATIHTYFLNQLINVRASTVNGYSGQRTWVIRNFPKLTAHFPNEAAQVELCKRASHWYVLYDPTIPELKRPITGLEPQAKTQLKLIEDEANGRALYELSCSDQVANKI